MKMPQRAQRKAEALRYAGLMLGTAVLSFGLYNVHSQSDITEGGVLGLQLLIQNWFGVSPSVIGPVLDPAGDIAVGRAASSRTTSDSGRSFSEKRHGIHAQLRFLLFDP